MKKTFFSLLCASALFVNLTASATSQPPKRPVASAPKSVAVASTSGGSSSRFGLGFTTYGGGSTGLTGGISGWLEFNALHSLQLIAAINSTSPSFGFGTGVAYRYNLFGDPSLGFHLGFGVNLGTTGGTSSNFFLSLVPTGGLHFSLGGHANNIQLAFSGGPSITVTPSPAQFTMSPFGLFGGASIHYFF